MWNLAYANRVCNEHERFREHRTHINKLLMTKTFLDIESPYKPQFLMNKCNHTQNEINRNLKITYENDNLLGKIRKIEKNYSKYHPTKIIVKDCPAYRKTNFRKESMQKEIDTENYVRLVIII